MGKEAVSIPDTLYVGCLNSLLEDFDRYFYAVQKVYKKVSNGQYELPKIDEMRRITYEPVIFQLYKLPDDPFDAVYTLIFKMRLSRFGETLEACLKKKKYYRFKFNEYKYKEELLEDFTTIVKDRYNIDLQVKIVKKIIEFKIPVVINVKTETTIIED